MVETTNGTARSAGITYQQLLAEDSHPVPEIMRRESPLPPGPTIVPAERYYSKAFHDLEVEKLWSRVWQMACHEDDIPEVGRLPRLRDRPAVVPDRAHRRGRVLRLSQCLPAPGPDAEDQGR